MINILELSNHLRRKAPLTYEKVDEDILRVSKRRYNQDTGLLENDLQHSDVRMQDLVDKKTQLEREVAACEEIIKEARKMTLTIPLSSI